MTGIYVHIPFCVKKCLYCDFNSYPGLRDMSYSYGAAVVREIESSPFKGADVDTVYFGGGTPTSVDTEIIIDILAALKILSRLGRIHTHAEFVDCFNSARRAGFENISVDLMFGLPGQSPEIWRDTLERITGLEPEHISAYSLKVEEGTPFYEMKKRGSLDIPDDDQNRAMYDEAVDFLKRRGYERYEISNFARTGFESRHNLIYWRLGDYIGFGAGAHSFAGGRRFSNPLGIEEYIDAVRDGGRITAEKESAKDMMSEFMFLGLRLDAGVSEAEFEQRFGAKMTDVFARPLNKHLNLTKALIKENGRIKLRPEYAYVSNIIMSDFII